MIEILKNGILRLIDKKKKIEMPHNLYYMLSYFLNRN